MRRGKSRAGVLVLLSVDIAQPATLPMALAEYRALRIIRTDIVCLGLLSGHVSRNKLVMGNQKSQQLLLVAFGMK